MSELSLFKVLLFSCLLLDNVKRTRRVCRLPQQREFQREIIFPKKIKNWPFLKRDKTANYTSPEIQNELLGLLAGEVRSKITLSVIDCSVYGIMVDGTVDVSSVEQFSFCVRYVTSSYKMNEKFLGFWDSPDSTGEALYENLM